MLGKVLQYLIFVLQSSNSDNAINLSSLVVTLPCLLVPSGDLFSADLNPRWRRPHAPTLNPSSDTLIFQQIDLDYYLGNYRQIINTDLRLPSQFHTLEYVESCRMQSMPFLSDEGLNMRETDV